MALLTITGSAIYDLGAGSDTRISQLQFATEYVGAASGILTVKRKIAGELTASATFYTLYLNNTVSTANITGSGGFFLDSSGADILISASAVTGVINLTYDHSTK